MLQSFQQVVIPELELRLKIKCEEAASFHEPKHRGVLTLEKEYIVSMDV